MAASCSNVSEQTLQQQMTVGLWYDLERHSPRKEAGASWCTESETTSVALSASTETELAVPVDVVIHELESITVQLVQSRRNYVWVMKPRSVVSEIVSLGKGVVRVHKHSDGLRAMPIGQNRI